MRILMIAPQPFFQPRGTPFSEFYRIRALLELGHTVDLVTYPIGEDVDMEGLTIYRTFSVPGIRSVDIGPSFSKIVLDILVFVSSFSRLLKRRYDLLDCHEEAGLFGVIFSKIFNTVSVYDMHSSLPEQLENFNYTRSKIIRYFFDVLEQLTIRGSAAVIYICPYLKEVIDRVDSKKPSFLIENSPLAESGIIEGQAEVEQLREKLDLDKAFILLYTGTFEAYQGLDLLFNALARIPEPNIRLLMVGGNPKQIEESKREVAKLGVSERVIFVGSRPPEEMSLYLSLSHVLVSPRLRGKNTPLKVYSYLHAGKPIVATRILTHTQVLDENIAVLTDPDPKAFSSGVMRIFNNPSLAQTLGKAARHRSDTAYSYKMYLERTKEFLDFILAK